MEKSDIASLEEDKHFSSLPVDPFLSSGSTGAKILLYHCKALHACIPAAGGHGGKHRGAF